jgi:large subunit ribosomal protein L5
VSKEKQEAEGAAKGADEAPVSAPPKAPKGDKPQKGAQGAAKGAQGAAKGGGAKGGGAKGGGAKGGGAKGQKGGKGDSGGEGKSKAPAIPDPPGYKPRLKILYLESVAKDLKEEFSYKSVMQVPRLSKIIVSMGLGEAIVNKKLLDSATQEMSQITGRKAVRTRRKDMDIGAMVTLRGNAMYEFLDRLINAAMPRIKDFRGANPNAFDGHGNYSLGVTEQIIFPEIDYDKIERVSGMNIAVVTTARTDQEARSLLARLGMPFRK